MAELKARLTFTEFLEWVEFIGWEEKRVSKADFYLAQIAAEVRRGYVRHPNQVKIHQFIVKMTGRSKDQEQRVQRSKTAWAAHLGIDVGKN